MAEIYRIKVENIKKDDYKKLKQVLNVFNTARFTTHAEQTVKEIEDVEDVGQWILSRKLSHVNAYMVMNWYQLRPDLSNQTVEGLEYFRYDGNVKALYMSNETKYKDANIALFVCSILYDIVKHDIRFTTADITDKLPVEAYSYFITDTGIYRLSMKDAVEYLEPRILKNEKRDTTGNATKAKKG